MYSRSQCDNCGSIWSPGSEEFDWQRCDACGWSPGNPIDEDDDDFFGDDDDDDYEENYYDHPDFLASQDALVNHNKIKKEMQKEEVKPEQTEQPSEKPGEQTVANETPHETEVDVEELENDSDEQKRKESWL